MSRKPNENWFSPEFWDKLNAVWRDRIQVLLEDLTGLGGLEWTVILDPNGALLTRVIGPGGGILPESEVPSLARYAKLAKALGQAWTAVGEQEPSHIVEEFDNHLVFTGFVSDLVIVVAFGEGIARGAVVMRLTKRIKHLISLQKNRERGALYV